MSSDETIRESLSWYKDYWAHTDSPFASDELDQIRVAEANGNPLTDDEWGRYFDLLTDACEFTSGDMTWSCEGGNDKSRSERVLRGELGLDAEQVERVHGLVDLFGGHCSCEILFNAADRILGGGTP